MNQLTVLVLNLIFILFTTFVFQYIIVNKFTNLYRKYSKTFIIILGGIQILFCMSFTVIGSSDFIFDLRLIPVVVGGLYGGPVVSIMLFITVVAARIPFGGNGVWINFFNMLTITVLIVYLSSKFRAFPLSRKLYTVVAVSLSYTVLIFLMKAAVFDDLSNFQFMLLYGLALSAGIFIVTYYIEIMRQNQLLHNAVIKSDKIEVVSQLAASVSHEVRNPLTVTRGFLQMLKDPTIEEKKRLYYLNTAIDELDRAESIIKDYLNFAKPQSEMESSICVKEEIEKALELILPYANHFSVNIKRDLMAGMNVAGEAAKFHQCILNIIKNGIEAMPNGGDLVISCREMANNHVSITIKDTGCGMSPQQLAKIGEPYFSTKAEKGTGLGMMVVNKIIHEMGGTVNVKSKLNEGTQFKITLPLYNMEKRET
ncbi:HAMP domain-containing sensor histidine kinase [Bacillus sp. ISL-37]|jgi:two-component system, sporulation sensor kinase B|uniref:sensor histidine kinase n=1 Tax=Bacillus sp. ISL-37 TaxID=2819123 RepID=UPI001BE4EBE9|nr:HAMP domain-containing sensor histidine kinase [Bacillus sp. ISL-37]MBT2684808.1 HAMP domain-containing histidine kinase [Bacillus sp. ISL-37]